MDTTSSDVVQNFPPFFKVHQDGRVERYILSDQVPPGPDPNTGAQSKDVVISTEPKISARIFLPKINGSDPPKKLPLLVHYHGGGFCVGSAFGPITKQFLTNFVSMAQAVAISVDYRLAPENPLPIAHDDSWAGFQWVAAHLDGNGPDPWLNEYVDFNRVFLLGESAGANIAHDVAIRASVTRLTRLRSVGLVSVHPYFAQKDPDRLIKYLYPTSSGADDNPRLNPGVDPRLDKLVCERVLVYVAENDSLKDRGVGYYNSLIKSGWGGVVELVETKGVGHCFHLFDPKSEEVGPLMQKLVAFINKD